MKKLFLLLFVTIYLYELCNAQYVGGANEQRKEEMKRDNERLNNVYNNNLPNDNGKNSVKILAPEYKKKEVYIPTESEKKREALRVSEAQEYNAKLKIQQQQRALNRYYTKLQYCNDLYNKNIANSILKSLDLKEFYRWAYADSYEGTKLLNSNSGYALGRLKLHQSDSGNTNFDTCINRLIDASIFSNTCVAELEKLKKRFPSKIVELEKLQLNAFIYYFGARFPNWESAGENDMAYAECQFQLSTVDEQNELLNEFLNLYYKHPEFTRAYIAGRARKNFNPFYLVTLAKQYSGGISQELRFNMLLQIFQTKENEITPIYKK